MQVVVAMVGWMLGMSAVALQQPQPFLYADAGGLAERYAAYEAHCALASVDDDAFRAFKAAPCYTNVLEHCSVELGRCYAHYIATEYPWLLEDAAVVSAARRSSALGGPPITADFSEFLDLGTVSPSQLRYLKVLGDLDRLGPFDSVCEVGVGYGGQAALVLARYPEVDYNVCDLAPVERLCARFLRAMDLGARSADRDGTFDLFLSNYALSELPSAVQAPYVDLAARSRLGYVTWNHGIHKDAMTSDDFVAALRERIGPRLDLQIRDEVPLTAPLNVIITWRVVADDGQQ